MQECILLVDDSPPSIQLMGRMLADHGELRFATSGQAALEMMRGTAPDLVLLDAEMPGMSGFEVCCAMKAEPELADIPVIFVTAHGGAEFEVAALDVGAADFIAKPVHETLLRARVRTQLRLKRLADELRLAATHDALTGAANRRGFERALEREWRRSQRNGLWLSLMLVDVDHFKLYNDHYGHIAGDTALGAVAGALREACMRPTDVVGRYGGEEFAVLLPDTPDCGAIHIAHRLLETMQRLGIAHATSPTAAHLTVSVGITTLPESDNIPPRASDELCCAPARPVENFLKSADRALYAAKHAGRAQAWHLDHLAGNEPWPALALVDSGRCARAGMAA
ncbi:MAG: diguanylate cyclase [Rhodocyclaceae bacterium]|nr:diguanylate cyclase [Rhodocyclaceae bacterium]MBX3670823.1 diguanylate cyclase [Rhodocyclaceae bacterium]